MSSSSPKNPLEWELLGNGPAQDHKIFRLFSQQSRHPITQQERDFVIVDCPHWVNMIALTPDDHVVLVKQFRHGTQEVTLEIPGGMVDDGEPPLEAAKRELREETGYASQQWIEIGMVKPNPAFQTNSCWTYLALDATLQGPPQWDPGEVIEVQLAPLARLPTLLKDGSIQHALVIAAFAHLTLHCGGWHRPG